MRGLGALLFLAMTFGVAYAQSPQDQVDKLFAEGRDLLVNQNNAKAACEKFEAAIALDSTAPGVMLNLGLCYEKLERYATSLFWFRKAQAAASEGRLAEYEQAAKDHTYDLANKVAIGRIDASSLPPDAEVSIEGRRVLPADYGRVELDLGPNRIEARARGKQPFSAVHQVTSREGGTIKIEMAADIQYETVDAGAGRRKLAYVVGGTSIAFGVACLVMNFKWQSDQEAAKTLEEHGKYEDKMRKWGTSLFGAAVGLGVTSVILYVTAPGIERREVQSARIAPYVDGDGAGVVFGGRF